MSQERDVTIKLTAEELNALTSILKKLEAAKDVEKKDSDGEANRLKQDTVCLTATNIRYNNLVISKLSEIQLELGAWIKVKRGDTVLTRHCHKTQKNRVDGVGVLLQQNQVGDLILVTWDEVNNILELKDSI